MAARNSKIILSANPQGKFMEGVVYGTPKPGTCMSIKESFYQGGWHQWEPFSGSTGERDLIVVLLEDDDQGKTISDAYVSGTRCFLYAPIPGEELNMLIADVSGTGDTHADKEKMIVETATGKLLVTASTPESEPFRMLGAATPALTADFLQPCIYTGY